MNSEVSRDLALGFGVRSRSIVDRHSFVKQFSNVAQQKPVADGGFTLVEVIISFFVFTLLAAGLFSSALQVRKWSEASVRESVATAVATGFLEQLAAADYPNIIRCVEDRSFVFDFVTEEGQSLDSAKTLLAMGSTDWGNPLEVPLVAKLDADGNEIPGTTMDFWFIPSVERSVDTPDNAVDIRIRFRWNNGRGLDVADMPVRTLYLVCTRVPN